jgi:hypothetical protein
VVLATGLGDATAGGGRGDSVLMIASGPEDCPNDGAAGTTT